MSDVDGSVFDSVSSSEVMAEPKNSCAIIST
jgi:hypothetical protein